MSGRSLRIHVALPLRVRLPGRRRVSVAALALGLVAVAVAALLLGPLPASSSGVPSSLYAARAAISPSPSPPDASPTPSRTASPSAPVLMTPRILVPPQLLTGYVWPLANGRVTLPFGPTSWGEVIVNGQRFHDGLDMSTGCGDRVLAAHDGVVLAAGRQYDDFVGWDGDLTPYYNWLTQHKYWNSVPIVVVIDDEDGYRSIYAHESFVTVQPYQRVKAGDVIGYEGMTGNASGCHVHFGLFSPLETRTFALDPGIVQRDQMPAREIARVDPLLVLPFRCDVEEMVALRPLEALDCPPPTQRPAVKPAPSKMPPSSATAPPSVEIRPAPSPATDASASASAAVSGRASDRTLS